MPDEQEDFDTAVAMIGDRLEEVALGASPAWSLSTALDAIDIRSRSTGPRLTREQRDLMLRSLLRAELGAEREKLMALDEIRKGVRAVSMQIRAWAGETMIDECRADFDAEARIFRNQVHNLALREQIAERAEQRESAIDDRRFG